jgi:beta-galactosidase
MVKNWGLNKPLYICEFVHAMFNSMGSLTDYSELFDNTPEILGGAIWEFQDQALLNKRNPDHPILAYGGGFGEFPNDQYFIHKGVVAWDRTTIKPHYPEMKKAFQWIETSLAQPELGDVWIKNKYQFISLDDFEGKWSLTENGVEISKGSFELPHIWPRSGWWANIPYKIESTKPGAEYYLHLSYIQKSKTLWADKGFEVATEQFKLPINTLPVAEPKVNQPVKLIQDQQFITVSGTAFTVIFDKKSGLISQLNKNGINVLSEDGSPKLYLWRAAHRNDDWWVDRAWDRYGVKSLTNILEDFKVEKIDDYSVKISTAIHAEGRDGFGAYHIATYLISGDGSIKVDNNVQFVGMRINLARIGIQMLLNKDLTHVNYFGRGPQENYADRKSAAEVGIYELEVNNQYEYEKPMERGNHEDVRWIKFTGNQMPELKITCTNLMQFSALPHTDEQMVPIAYKIDLPASTSTVFCLSAKTLGVGSASCGPKPLGK